MPTQINGIGTTYFGSKNAIQENGLCERCGAHTVLSSYDTGFWFTVFYIPVIPLGRKMILNYCSNCTGHQAINLSEWHVMRDQSIESSTQELSMNMDDGDKALEHLGTLSAFFQIDEARELAAAIENSFSDDVDIMLGLASWYEHHQFDEDADRCFDRAFHLDPNNRVCIRARGLGLIAKGKLAEATQMLNSFRPPAEDFDPVIFFVLGNAFQMRDDHAAALENFAPIVDHAPDWKNDADFCRAVRTSERAVGVNNSMVPKAGNHRLALAIFGLLVLIGVVIAVVVSLR